MRATFQNSGAALSIGAFFSLMIAGLASTLPHTLTGALASLLRGPRVEARDALDELAATAD